MQASTRPLWPPWAPPLIIGLMLVAGTAIGLVVLRTQWRIDDLSRALEAERSQNAGLREALSDLPNRAERLERLVADARLRIDRLAIPMCPTFYGRSLRTSSNDDQPADPKRVTAAQWRRLASIARYLPAAACVEDLRADDEALEEEELEVVLTLADGHTLEVDLRRDSEVSEVELLIASRNLPPSLRRSATDHRCRPRKTELSLRPPVEPKDVRRLLDWWAPAPTGQYPATLWPRLVVEFDCGANGWDLELRPDASVLRNQRAGQ